jgi:hypothetical protein
VRLAPPVLAVLVCSRQVPRTQILKEVRRYVGCTASARIGSARSHVAHRQRPRRTSVTSAKVTPPTSLCSTTAPWPPTARISPTRSSPRASGSIPCCKDGSAPLLPRPCRSTSTSIPVLSVLSRQLRRYGNSLRRLQRDRSRHRAPGARRRSRRSLHGRAGQGLELRIQSRRRALPRAGHRTLSQLARRLCVGVHLARQHSSQLGRQHRADGSRLQQHRLRRAVSQLSALRAFLQLERDRSRGCAHSGGRLYQPHRPERWLGPLHRADAGVLPAGHAVRRHQ